jgi:hypothetical protein
MSDHGARARAPADPPIDDTEWMEFVSRWEGMRHAMRGGLWLHRHVWKGERMAHLVSTDRDLLLRWGARHGLPSRRLQFKRLKDPDSGERRDAWHWDLVGPYLPGPARR